MTDWQDIESAPRDGTRFDAWEESIDLDRTITGRRITGVYWAEDEKDCVSFAGGEWTLARSGDCDYPVENCNTRLTCWMPTPLPPPPKVKA